MESAELLTPGDPFPSLSVPAATGGDLLLPDDAEGLWAAVLIYRGHW